MRVSSRCFSEVGLLSTLLVAASLRSSFGRRALCCQCATHSAGSGGRRKRSRNAISVKENVRTAVSVFCENSNSSPYKFKQSF